MDNQRLKVLIIDDDEDDFVMAKAVLDEIQGKSFDPHWASSYDRGLTELLEQNFQVCLIDYRLGAKTGLDLISFARQSGVSIPLIMLTGQGDVEIDRAALNAGASDYLVKSELDAPQLGRSIRYSIQQALTLKLLETEKASLADRVLERTEELTIVNEQLAKAVKSKDEFLAAMSHELRTPLTGILAMAEILRDQLYGEMNAKQIGFAANIYDNGLHLLDLINDVLDIAKFEAGKFELHKTEINLQDLCHSSINLIKQQAFQHKLELIVEIDKEVIFFQADGRRLKQVLVNLFSNAIKFTPEGGKIGLDVISDKKQSKLRFEVWDTGVGIAEDKIPMLFMAFVQLDSSLSRNYQGTGLGLALVERMVHKHNGHVLVKSQLNKGSRFIVEIPWDPPTMPVKVSASVENSEIIAPASELEQNKLILVVDDDKQNNKLFAGFLRKKGYRVNIAYNGLEAISSIKKEMPELVLMDVQMPEMNGLDAIRFVRKEIDQQLPIIALTALAMDDDFEYCLAAGANKYLSKPVQLFELLLTIKELLND